MFHGRTRELEALRAELSSAGRTAVLVYGKRRVGKSTLIARAARDFKGVVVNHICVQSTFEGNLELLCRSVSQALGMPAMSFRTIFDLLDFLKAQGRPVLLVLDEYQYFKQSLKGGQLDSCLQAAIDRLPPQVKLVLCGSYVTVMRELMEESNPLFGRFTSVIALQEMDYLDAQRFYPSLPVREKIARYAVFGGSPFVLASLDGDEPLAESVKRLLVPQNGLLRSHIENVMLAEVRKRFDVRILHALGNGRMRYSGIASALGGDKGGLLSKQLASLLDMETVGREAPINRASDRRKTLYFIRDNLMRFYFRYLFANEGLAGRIGEDALYDSAIAPTLDGFVSLGFEGMAAQYFSRLARAGLLQGVQGIGTYWFDDRESRASGQFDCVVRRNGGYDFYEAKYCRRPMGAEECRREEAQVRRAAGLPGARVGFVCSAGFDFASDDYDLISGEDMFSPSLLEQG